MHQLATASFDRTKEIKRTTRGKIDGNHTRVGVSLGTQEMKMILLLQTRVESANHSSLISIHPCTIVSREDSVVPLALAATEIELDVVDSITRSGVALVVTSGLEMRAEDLVVGVLRDLVDDDLLLVVGDLEDDELGLGRLATSAHAEFVECINALIGDGNTIEHKHNWSALGSTRPASSEVPEAGRRGHVEVAAVRPMTYPEAS